MRGVLVAICLALCAYIVYMLVAKYAFGNNMPTVFGYAGAQVVSGSMDDDSGDDDIEINDFVIVRADNSYAIGDVITFYDSDFGGYITHRVIGTYDGGYITHGDANDDNSLERPSYESVVGKVVFVIKGVGSVINFINSPAGLLVVIGAGVLIWFAADIISDLFNRQKDEESED